VDPWGWSCTPNKKTSYQATSRRDAFRQAKRDAGIPVTASPTRLYKQPLDDGYGSPVMQNGQPVMTRNYEYLNIRHNKITIQEYSYGHSKATHMPGAEPHFNARQGDKLRSGSADGTHGHYNFGSEK
jgi:hypothetical protein